MTEVYKNLFGYQPAAATPQTTATPAAGKAWIISRLNVANVSASNDTFTIQRTGGQYYASGETMSKHTHDKYNGIVMAAGDTLILTSTGGNISFNAEGAEITY